MLYEMVTGRSPFLGNDSVAGIGQHINTPPVAHWEFKGGAGSGKTPDFKDGQVCLETTIYLSLTFYYRIVYGAPAAEVLQSVKGYFGRPLVDGALMA